jgi:hypothetical protein
MAIVLPDGNRVGAIIQSMFARIKILWARGERKSSSRRISLTESFAAGQPSTAHRPVASARDIGGPCRAPVLADSEIKWLMML